MQTLHNIQGLLAAPRGAVVSIGNFDGMHRGHARLIELARAARTPDSPIVVVTFEPHPLTVLRPESAPPRLTPFPLKQEILAAMGVDWLVVLPPVPEVLDLTANDFWALLRGLAPSRLVEGPGFHFGKDRGGTLPLLQQWAGEAGIAMDVAEQVEVVLNDLSIVQVSSTLVRWLVQQGRMRDAAICFGRPYTLEGPVVRGFGRGKSLGFATANLNCSTQLLPADGVYAARCAVGGGVWPAALSVGTLPTFNEARRQVEAHLIGFEGDLYDATLRVEVVDWLRDQRKFPSLDLLKAQVARDIADARRRAEIDPASPPAAGLAAQARCQPSSA